MQQRTFAVTTTAQVLLGPSTDIAFLQADSVNTSDIYVGSASVTGDTAATGGLRLPAGSGVGLVVHPGEFLWAVAGSGTQYLRVLTGAGLLDFTEAEASGPSSGVQVEGTLASGAVETGNPVTMGVLVNTTFPAADVTGKRKSVWGTQYGSPVVAIGDTSANVAQAQTPSADGALRLTGLTVITNPKAFIDGSNLDRVRTPNVFKTVTTAATGSTAAWTPTTGKKFRLMRYALYVTANAVAAAAAMLEITLLDAAGAIGVGWSVFIPAAAGTVIGTAETTGLVTMDNGFLSALANNVLNVNLSFALTGGEVRVVTMGTEE